MMQSRLFVVMGVAGCGKSSIGAAFAQAVGGTYIDGDDFHPQSNIDKMEAGIALNDDDRWPWLEIVAQELSQISGISIVGCSALKRAYRDFIALAAGESVGFIHLDGSKELIAKRMAAREGHFMPTSLLESQFAALEVPDETENAISIDISGDEQSIVSSITNTISLQE